MMLVKHKGWFSYMSINEWHVLQQLARDEMLTQGSQSSDQTSSYTSQATNLLQQAPIPLFFLFLNFGSLVKIINQSFMTCFSPLFGDINHYEHVVLVQTGEQVMNIAQGAADAVKNSMGMNKPTSNPSPPRS